MTFTVNVLPSCILYGVLAMKTATAETKPCKKCVYILSLNVATL